MGRFYTNGMIEDSPLQIAGRRHLEETYPFLAGVVPTYDGPARLLNWQHSAKDGMTVDVVVALPGPLGGHPFRGMLAGKERGQRFYVAVNMARQLEAGAPILVHQGETLLLRWSENDRSGMSVRFLLDDGPDGISGRHPFFGLAIGRTTGEALELVAWGVADDEQGLPPSRLRQRTPFHSLTEVQQSSILCKDARFRAFLNEHLVQLVPDERIRSGLHELHDKPEVFAVAVVRAALGVTTRSVMNRNGAAAQEAIAKWRTMLVKYEEWAWGIRR